MASEPRSWDEMLRTSRSFKITGMSFAAPLERTTRGSGKAMVEGVKRAVELRSDVPPPAPASRHNAARDEQLRRDNIFDPITSIPRTLDVERDDELKARPRYTGTWASSAQDADIPYQTIAPFALEQMVGKSTVGCLHSPRRNLQPRRDYDVVNGGDPPGAPAGTAPTSTRDEQIQIAADRFWRTHNFDILSQQYLDPSKEHELRETEQHRLLQMTKKRVTSLPPSLRRSHSQLYDIVTGGVKDTAGLDDVERKEHAYWSAKKGKDQIADELRTAHDAVADRQAMQALNTRARRGRENAFRPEYDIVTNEVRRFDWQVRREQGFTPNMNGVVMGDARTAGNTLRAADLASTSASRLLAATVTRPTELPASTKPRAWDRIVAESGIV